MFASAGRALLCSCFRGELRNLVEVVPVGGILAKPVPKGHSPVGRNPVGLAPMDRTAAELVPTGRSSTVGVVPTGGPGRQRAWPAVELMGTGSGARTAAFQSDY